MASGPAACGARGRGQAVSGRTWREAPWLERPAAGTCHRSQSSPSASDAGEGAWEERLVKTRGWSGVGVSHRPVLWRGSPGPQLLLLLHIPLCPLPALLFCPQLPASFRPLGSAARSLPSPCSLLGPLEGAPLPGPRQAPWAGPQAHTLPLSRGLAGGSASEPLGAVWPSLPSLAHPGPSLPPPVGAVREEWRTQVLGLGPPAGAVGVRLLDLKPEDAPSQPRLSLFLLQPAPGTPQGGACPPHPLPVPLAWGLPTPSAGRGRLHSRSALPPGSAGLSPQAFLTDPLPPHPSCRHPGFPAPLATPHPLAPKPPTWKVGPYSSPPSGDQERSRVCLEPGQRRSMSPDVCEGAGSGLLIGQRGRTDGCSLSPAGAARLLPPSSLLPTPGLADRAGRVASSSEPRRLCAPHPCALPTPGARSLQGAGPRAGGGRG